MESLGSKLTRKARVFLDSFLDSFLDKWSWTNKKSPNLGRANEREAARALWKKIYHKTAMWTMKMIHSSTIAPQQVRPDEKEGPKMEDPEDVEDFVTMLLANF